ncbi:MULTISPECIES: hypothetical protein [Variovorax]|jgi:hypothetical protein|uniref:Uncharacterized protein n=1 Tax=Variovorax paradoxus TaxID=34073 RepID=A0AAW8EG33_VARPD|nr:hypothetical protein [Variovorax paradoxus]MDP9972106.1 hypothetical protein [Variovorax paradoxus]
MIELLFEGNRSSKLLARAILLWATLGLFGGLAKRWHRVSGVWQQVRLAVMGCLRANGSRGLISCP